MAKKLSAIVIVSLVIFLGLFFLRTKSEPQSTTHSSTSKESPSTSLGTSKPTFGESQISQNDKPQIVSTNPSPLDEAIIPADQVLEITFNRPLENVGEFKLRIDPKIDVKVELSGDRKTAKIIPAKPYELGSGYTLFIGTETKFDGVGRWGEEKVFHFRTIRYRGI